MAERETTRERKRQKGREEELTFEIFRGCGRRNCPLLRSRRLYALLISFASLSMVPEIGSEE